MRSLSQLDGIIEHCFLRKLLHQEASWCLVVTIEYSESVLLAFRVYFKPTQSV